MIATVLLAGMMHQYGRAYVTCLQFVKAYFIGDRNPEITFDAEASKHATFGSEDYKYKDAHLLASPRTGEITIFVNFSHGGAKNSLPRIDPKNPTKDQILNAILVFRPTGESSYRKEEHSSQGEITFRLLQTIQGVPVSDVAVFLMKTAHDYMDSVVYAKTEHQRGHTYDRKRQTRPNETSGPQSYCERTYHGNQT